MMRAIEGRKTWRYLLSALLLGVVVDASAPPAHADSVYAISFTGAGAPTVVGSDLLTFSSALDEFTTPSIEISVGGVDITLANELGQYVGINPNTDVLQWDFFAYEFSHLNATITDSSVSPGIVYDGNVGCPPGVTTGPCTAADCIDGCDLASGGVQLTAQVSAEVPEPATGVLILIGIGLTFVMRKRKVSFQG